MKLTGLLAAGLVAAATLTTPAAAAWHRGYHHGYGYHRGFYHGGWRGHYYRGGYHRYGWRGGHGRHCAYRLITGRRVWRCL